MSDRKKQLLNRLENFFKNDEDVEEASIFTAEELGTPMDMLRVLVAGYGPELIEVLAEYSFIPFEGADEVWYFSSIITIMTDSTATEMMSSRSVKPFESPFFFNTFFKRSLIFFIDTTVVFVISL